MPQYFKALGSLWALMRTKVKLLASARPRCAHVPAVSVHLCVPVPILFRAVPPWRNTCPAIARRLGGLL